MFSEQDDLQVTDEQIQLSATDEWMAVLMSLWDAAGKNANDDEKRLTSYARQLSIIPLELLQKSIDRAIQSNGKYLTVPAIGAIWDALRKELKKQLNIPDGMDMEEAIDLWCRRKFEQGVVRFEQVNHE